MNVIEVLQELGLTYAEPGEHRHVGREWIGISPCPGCGSTDFHLAISTSGRACSCWRCGPMRVWDTLARASNRPVGEIGRLLGVASHPGPQNAPAGHRTLAMPYGVGPLGAVHREYLATRQIDTVQAVTLWQIGGIGHDGGDLSWRLFLPIMQDCETVSWTTRSIREGGRRYISAAQDQERKPHKQLLYGLDYVRHAAIIVEGPLDVLRVGPGAVCTFGTAFTEHQLAKLAKIPVRVVCYDTDYPGRRAAANLVRQLEPLPGSTVIITLETGKDAGEASKSEIDALRSTFLED